MTNEINPNRGGPIHSCSDTQSLRFPMRGRSDTDSSGTYRDRLQAQIEKPGVEVSYCPEINTEAVIEPSTTVTVSIYDLSDKSINPEPIYTQELGRAWLNGLEFGGEHD